MSAFIYCWVYLAGHDVRGTVSRAAIFASLSNIALERMPAALASPLPVHSATWCDMFRRMMRSVVLVKPRTKQQSTAHAGRSHSAN
jgi:hypothetical protein